jgi:hypothetical protein
MSQEINFLADAGTNKRFVSQLLGESVKSEHFNDDQTRTEKHCKTSELICIVQFLPFE